MHKRLVVLLAVSMLCGLAAAGRASAVAAAATGSATGAPVATAPGTDYVPGELLVEFRAQEGTSALRAAVRTHDADVVRALPASGADPGCRLVLVRSATLTTGALAASLARDPAVVRTCPDYLRRTDAAVPDDPGLVDQWGLLQVGAPQAWQTTTGTSDVVVADIDTGVDVLHPDLASDLWRNPGEIPGNGIDDDHNGYVDDVYGIDAVNHTSTPTDDVGHGTHTAGIMAAVADNATGVAGVAPGVRVMALKFINAYGWGTDAEAIACIDYAVNEKLDHGVNVVAINASWGWFNRDVFLRDAISRAGDAGIVFCASAGNDAMSNDRLPHYPASYSCPNIIAVAATGPGDRLARFSDWGARTVDLGAPGESILSTLPTATLGYDEDGPMYGSWDGTSMAAPFVTGAVALLASAHPGDSMTQRIARILSTVKRVPALRGRCVTGGRLDIAAALGSGPTTGDLTAPQTTVLGCDDRWHRRPVELRFVAVDEQGGSGVAVTVWRIHGGPWRAGTSVVVPAPPATKAAYVVDYRSRDKAGNLEAMKSCTVLIDTTQPIHAGVPGVPLPASPFFVDLPQGSVDHDVYQVALDAGQSLRVVAGGLPARAFALALYPPQTQALGWTPSVASSIEGDGGAVLDYCAPQSGTYYLDVRVAGRPSACRLDWAIVAAGVDVTPPTVSAAGVESDDEFGAWYDRPVPLSFLADDGATGSGVASVEWSNDGGLTWTAGTHLTVDAPADHSNDGVHVTLYRATDEAGNVSQPSSCAVAIDTAGPVTAAWGPLRPVRRGQTARIAFKVRDLSTYVWAQLVVRSVTTGRTVRTMSLGWSWAGEPWPGSPDARVSLRCTMAPGSYEVLIAGLTHDVAGNLPQSAVCRRVLRVR